MALRHTNELKIPEKVLTLCIWEIPNIASDN